MIKILKCFLLCIVCSGMLLTGCKDDPISKEDFAVMELAQVQKLAKNQNPDALVYLADLFTTGSTTPHQKVPVDLLKAKVCLEKAAALGSAEGQFKLGELLLKGAVQYKIKAEPKNALYWIEQSALHDYALAQLKLGEMYEKGHVVTRDYALAFKWYEQAAQQGVCEAQYALAVMYQRGRGVRQNEQKAVHWFMMAAQQGHAMALYSLGHIYQQGRYVEKDLSKAKEFYGLACDNGLQRGCDSYRSLHQRGVNQLDKSLH